MNISSDPSRPYVQDMPPATGYGEVTTKRNVPVRGPSGVALLFGAAASMAFGFYMVARSNRRHRYVHTHRVHSRHLIAGIVG